MYYVNRASYVHFYWNNTPFGGLIMKTRRILSFILIVALLSGVFPFATLAYGGDIENDSENVQYQGSENVALFIDSDIITGADPILPATPGIDIDVPENTPDDQQLPGIPLPSDLYLQVELDGEAMILELPVAPRLIGELILVPIQSFGALLGFETELDLSTGIVKTSDADHIFEFSVNKQSFMVDGDLYDLDFPLSVFDDIVYLPANIFEFIGYTIEWDNANATLLITSPRPAPMMAAFALSAANLGFSTVLSFNPADAVSNEDGSVIYFSDKAGKKVVCVDTRTFEQKALPFALMPESMHYKDNRLYVSLCAQPHSSFWWENDQYGAFAIIDCDTFTTIVQHNINIDPYDIIVSNDDNIYIASGSGQWTSILGFSQSGELVAKGQIRQASTIKYNPQNNKIYSITSDLSPRNMSAYVFLPDGSFYDTGVNMGTSYSWPYHGAFNSSTQFSISPDGRYIFNNFGYLMDCSENRADDMIKGRELNKSFNDIAFDLPNNIFYLAMSNNMIHSFSYDLLVPVASYAATSGSVERVFLASNDLIALTKAPNNVYCIEIISKSCFLPPNTDNDYGVVFKSEVTSAVYDKETHKTYIIDKGAKELAVFDHVSESITARAQLGSRPDGICVSADGRSIWIVNDNSSYLASEYDIYTLTKKRDLLYSVPVNADAVRSHRHIAVGAGKVFIADGQWEPQMYVFNEQTLAFIDNYGVLPGIGGMRVDEAQQFLYTWYQYGWSAGYAGSRLYKYSVTGARAVLVSQFDPSSWTMFDRDPLDSPILLYGSELIIKGKLFNASNLSSCSNRFPETIYAIDPAKGIAAGINGLYEISTGMLIRRTNFTGSNALIYDKNGNLFFSKNGALQRYKAVSISINATNTQLKAGQNFQLSVSAVFSDGSTASVTPDCGFSSANTAVASVSSSGLVSAIKAGAAEVRVSYDGLSASFIVGVDIDVTSITVAGYVLNFTPSQTSYLITLPFGTTIAPLVSYTAPAGLRVSVTPASSLPGVTTVEVSDANRLFIKTYSIRFFVGTPPPQPSGKPFLLDGSFSVGNGLVYLNAQIIINPAYYGAIPGEYYFVTQLISKATSEPILVAALKNATSVNYAFSDKFFASTVVVDRFGQRNYIGVLLSEPKFANLY